MRRADAVKCVECEIAKDDLVNNPGAATMASETFIPDGGQIADSARS